MHTRAADSLIKKTARSQADIANNFGIYAKTGSAREQTIVRVAGEQFGCHIRRLR